MTKKLSFSFLPIPEELMGSKAISWGAKYLFGIIAKANKEKIRWSVKYLAKRMDCTPRETSRRVKELKENNLIIVKGRKGRVNEYIVNLELIQSIQTPDQSVGGQESQNCHETPDRSGQGSPTGNGQGNSKEHSLKKTIKDVKRLKKYHGLRGKLVEKKIWLTPLRRTKVQEEVGAQLRPSGK